MPEYVPTANINAICASINENKASRKRNTIQYCKPRHKQSKEHSVCVWVARYTRSCGGHIVKLTIARSKADLSREKVRISHEELSMSKVSNARLCTHPLRIYY